MSNSSFKDIEKLEADLWDAADNLRANSKLTAGEYCMPVLGVIFLRHATNRYAEALREIQAEQAAGKIPKRPLTAADFKKRRALLLPKEARYDELLKLPKGSDLGAALVEAMNAIERDFEPLQGQLPKDYTKFENTLLEDLLRVFDSETLRTTSGDIFGRINEYFLMKFAMQGAQDNGEFFTPPSLVQTIVNVIEPDHGTVFDPACGSGGMFVQSSHFIERRGESAAHRVTFYGQEYKTSNLRLAKMNLAVHALEGNIVEANTFYDDPHRLPEGKPLWGNCDFLMANPPFNVDKVDAEKAKVDRRLPFGLPGVNKDKKVSNGNYLWISYFWSYLNKTGRAGFVMSSQASSAGHGEKEVRKKIVETGDVDVMISIRSNFFYTRTVPCELWHFDRAKPPERKDKVLMLDARNVYRKVTRKIYDFSPEQMQNLTAIVWLYRGQKNRFVALVRDYLERMCTESEAIPAALAAFDTRLMDLRGRFDCLADAVAKHEKLDSGKQAAFAEAATELREAVLPYEADRKKLFAAIGDFVKKFAKALSPKNDTQHKARNAYEPIAEATRGLIKQVDLLYKLATRIADLGTELSVDEVLADAYDRRAAGKLVKQLDEGRKAAVEQLKHAVYFHRQVTWLQDRFPKAELEAVPGLVRLVDRKEIEAGDWSLNPGRYVGVAPPEEDEDFDFEQTLRDIHTELADLNKEAAELAAKIQENFEELGI